jgi:hypothetical protein
MFSAVTSFPLFDNLFEDNELNKIEFRQKFNEKEGIVVGHSVWIGSGAYIMPGVKIGNGVTIAANSVVTKDVPDYALVAGSPAKNIKMKHDLDTIAKLNKIAWWDWDEKVIKNRIEDFYHKDIQSFVNTYYHE